MLQLKTVALLMDTGLCSVFYPERRNMHRRTSSRCRSSAAVRFSLAEK
jgi:hypothetical protein